MITSIKSLYSPDSLVSLQSDYAAHLKALLADIAQLKTALGKDAAQPERVQKLYHLIHNLCGSGATFGFPTITQTGLRVHQHLKPLMERDASEWPAVLRSESFLHDLDIFERACNHAIANSAQPLARSAPRTAPQANDAPRRVCILCPPGCELNDVDAQLRHFGYVVAIADTLEAFKDTIRAHAPDVLIAYSDMPERDMPALAALPSEAQMIIISPVESFEARLAAVRSGAMGYFTTPADVLQVIDKIEQLMAQTHAAPEYHVLIVDDDEMLMKFYTHALKRGGIMVTSVSSPKEAL